MSELIKKYKVPEVNKQQFQRGIRIVEETGLEDALGQTLRVGDLALYNREVSTIRIVKVIGMYTTAYPDANGNYRTVSTVSFVSQSTNYRIKGKLYRSGTQPNKLVKLLPEQTQKVNKELIEA